MRGEVKALALGIMAGIILLSIVVSMDFSYQTSTTAVAYVVNASEANIALIPNNISLQSPQGYFAFINQQGELQINFGNVAPNSIETLYNVFYVKNNLNQSVTVIISTPSPGNYNLQAFTNTQSASNSIQFTLGPGQQVPISLVLNVGNVTPGADLSMTIQVSATY